MDAIELYYSPVSGNSSRVVFALYEGKIPFTPHPIDVPAGQGRDPAYRALNPMGKVPTLVHGGVRLWESNAINWYLAELFPQSGLLPLAPERRASVQRWLYFQVGHVTPACFAVFRSTSARIQKVWPSSGDPQSVEAGRKELARFLPVLDEALAGRVWLEGDFSLADLAYAPHLWLLSEGGFDFAATPRVRDWLERLLAREAWLAARKMVFGE